MQVKYKLEYDMGKQHMGPLTFRIPKILKDWVEAIKKRGATNIKIKEEEVVQ